MTTLLRIFVKPHYKLMEQNKTSKLKSHRAQAYISPHYYYRLEKIIEDRGECESVIVREAIKQYLDREAQKNGGKLSQGF